MINFLIVGIILVLLFIAAILWTRSLCLIEAEWSEGNLFIWVRISMIGSLFHIIYKQQGRIKFIECRIWSLTLLKWKFDKRKYSKASAEKKVARKSLMTRLKEFKANVSNHGPLIKKLMSASDIERFDVNCYLSWKQPAITGMVYGLFYMFDLFIPDLIHLRVLPVANDASTNCTIFLKYHFYFFNFLNILLSYKKEKKNRRES